MNGGRRRLALAAVSAGNFSQLGARILLGAVVPFVLVEFGTTEATVGVALTGMWAAYALLQFPSGVLADRLGERPVVLAGIVGAGFPGALRRLSFQSVVCSRLTKKKVWSCTTGPPSAKPAW